ncbi:hypothetical protein DPMN_155031 [Dreissena polymorpha]|uniref:Uncharacterized protein n=1 Tax=Dreissena polymorpha TaxID=45954 RepID=A0A9D4JAZ9_DREPO|nr:hypothetical protein DPMN_155031 [Dreissena polymorpha]
MMPAEPRCVIRDLPRLTGAPPGTTGMNRGKPVLHRESIKMFNTSGINRESPGRTGNDRRGTGNNRDGTGNNRDGNAPLNAGRVPV